MAVVRTAIGLIWCLQYGVAGERTCLALEGAVLRGVREQYRRAAVRGVAGSFHERRDRGIPAHRAHF
jgi:hypothetical protein